MTMLSVENLSLYYGAAQALRGVSVSASLGEVTCVLGRNGVGKTSLLRAIAGHRPISGGNILFEGRDIARLKPFERAALGIAYVPQGREIFPLLTVKENLETGFAPLKRGEKTVPEEVFELFPVLKSMLGRRGGDLPTEGIQPSIIKDIGRAITYLRERKDMAILLVEQYFDFARDLADRFVVMERGEIVQDGDRSALEGDDVRQRLAI